MKILKMSVSYRVSGETQLLVPDWMTIDEALEYAEEHIEEIELPENPTFDFDSIEIDSYSCGFEEDKIVIERDEYLDNKKSCA